MNHQRNTNHLKSIRHILQWVGVTAMHRPEVRESPGELQVLGVVMDRDDSGNCGGTTDDV